MSISLLGYTLSFFGQFSHGTIVVALSLTFLNLLKSCDLVLFSWRKMQKTKKNAALFKIFYIISPQGEHFRTWFKQILKATVQGYNFRFWSIFRIWSCDHPPITYWLDPDRYNHHYLLFSHLRVKNYWYFPFWTSTLDPECITQQYWPPLLFFSDFSPILCLFFI